jgi:DNA-binding MarR family transcriptional regulator
MPSVLRALADLRRLELTRSFLCPDDDRSTFYVLTPMGRRIDAQLQR